MGEPSTIDMGILNAASWGCTPLVRRKLDDGANIESTGPDGDTPLLLAIKDSVYVHELYKTPTNNELVEFLLKRGADVNAMTRYGRSAIHICASGGSVTQLMLLLEHKADVNQKTRIGQKNSPLHISSINDHVEFAKCLIHHGADIDSLDITHRTPLMAAVAASYTPLMNLEIVKYLIEEGANLMLRGLDGQTTKSLSIGMNREELTKVIQAAIQIKETCMAFAFGSIQRLGEGSVVNQIDPLAMKMILHEVLYEKEKQ
jgi:ankyrin repeat protein